MQIWIFCGLKRGQINYIRKINRSCLSDRSFYLRRRKLFYGDLVYKFRKIIGKNDFPYHFKKIIVRHKKIG